jgi:hypothetical protein
MLSCCVVMQRRVQGLQLPDHLSMSVRVQVGGLIKRLDTGEGSYAKELEEDYDVADQLDQVWRAAGCSVGAGVLLAPASSCNR